MRSLVFILLFCCSFTIAAQSRFRAGIRAGIATTQVDGDTYTGYRKAGFAGGAFVTSRLSDKLGASFEIMYAQKGSKHVGNPEENDFSYYLMDLQYVEVPVLLQYYQKKFTFELGPGFGYLIEANEYDFFGPLLRQKAFNSLEISGNAGVSYTLFKRLSVNWRFSYSILPIRVFTNPNVAVTYNPGQRNNLFQFALKYTFGKPDE